MNAPLSVLISQSVWPVFNRTVWMATPSFIHSLLSLLSSKEEDLDEHNAQVTPPGFHLIFLPFTDDLRRLKYEQTPKGNLNLIPTARTVK